MFCITDIMIKEECAKLRFLLSSEHAGVKQGSEQFSVQSSYNSAKSKERHKLPSWHGVREELIR